MRRAVSYASMCETGFWLALTRPDRGTNMAQPLAYGYRRAVLLPFLGERNRVSGAISRYAIPVPCACRRPSFQILAAALILLSRGVAGPHWYPAQNRAPLYPRCVFPCIGEYSRSLSTVLSDTVSPLSTPASPAPCHAVRAADVTEPAKAAESCFAAAGIYAAFVVGTSICILRNNRKNREMLHREEGSGAEMSGLAKESMLQGTRGGGYGRCARAFL